MYHITKQDNLSSILQSGLLVNSGNGGFVAKRDISIHIKKYGLQPVFLTNDIEHTIATQLTSQYLKDCVILKIKTEHLKLEEEFEYLEQNWSETYMSQDYMKKALSTTKRNKTYISKNNIPLEYISVYKVL